MNSSFEPGTPLSSVSASSVPVPVPVPLVSASSVPVSVPLVSASSVAVSSSAARLPYPLAVADCAVDSVAACLGAAGDLAEARTGRRPVIELGDEHVAAAVRSEVWLRDAGGRGIGGFAPLSRLWEAADGWVRTHANYPWHREALLAALGVTGDPDAVAAAIRSREAAEVERVVYEHGGLAVAARTAAQWSAGQGTAGQRAAGQGTAGQRAAGQGTAGQRAAEPGTTERRTVSAGPDLREVPLIGIERIGTGEPLPPAGVLPASGLRVLDLTRVIAGPVGTRMLGALGADVLRVDDPNRPELPLHAVDGIIGKASCLLDGVAERAVLDGLVAAADVVVTGYRPGAMRRLGLDPATIAERHPGTIVATLSAWGAEETRDVAGAAAVWGSRRGFDSLVQVACGIGMATSVDGERPGALPCQLLDHASGYLLAAGVLTALANRERNGEVGHVSVSLARTGKWVLEREGGSAFEERAADDHRVDLGGGWSGISPPGRLDARALEWPHLPPAYGRSEAAYNSSSR
ncbi:CoA transferase [Actinoplanes sp. NPDC051851]|uniref:CoA transferase n=1 Tax=Actinoplanes sp. NPDC051851 TaxID=3154753 RepID=UPI00342319D5